MQATNASRRISTGLNSGGCRFLWTRPGLSGRAASGHAASRFAAARPAGFLASGGGCNLRQVQKGKEEDATRRGEESLLEVMP